MRIVNTLLGGVVSLVLACTRPGAGSAASTAAADADATTEVAVDSSADTSALDTAGSWTDAPAKADNVDDASSSADLDRVWAGVDEAEVDSGEEEVAVPGDALGPDSSDLMVFDGPPDTVALGTDAAADVQVDVWFPVKGDAVGDSQAGAPDTVDAGAEISGPCKDIRKRGDVKILQDRCWDPPAHYCSGPEFQSFVFGCKADFSVCCAFPTSCWPCGWVLCPYVPPGGNLPDGAPSGCPTDWTGWKTLSMPGCGPYMPPEDQEFCWDGVPDEWKTPAFHMDGG